MKKVYVVGGDYLIEKMFRDEGWEVVNHMAKGPHLVCFSGGEDVSPVLYGEVPHPTTHSNWNRDVYEITQFDAALRNELPMVGICRGGQFLNVMCGGRLWQDVDSHAIRGTHKATRLDTEVPTYVNVTSTHHQMMRPSEDGVVLLQSDKVGEVRSSYSAAYQVGVEAVMYTYHRCLCFQPHPEYGKVAEETKALFFEYIEKYLHLRGE